MLLDHSVEGLQGSVRRPWRPRSNERVHHLTMSSFPNRLWRTILLPEWRVRGVSVVGEDDPCRGFSTAYMESAAHIHAQQCWLRRAAPKVGGSCTDRRSTPRLRRCPPPAERLRSSWRPAGAAAIGESTSPEAAWTKEPSRHQRRGLRSAAHSLFTSSSRSSLQGLGRLTSSDMGGPSLARCVQVSTVQSSRAPPLRRRRRERSRDSSPNRPRRAPSGRQR